VNIIKILLELIIPKEMLNWTLNFEPKFDYVGDEFSLNEENLDEQLLEKEANKEDFAMEILATLNDSREELDFLEQQFEDDEDDANYLKMRRNDYYVEAA